MTKNVVTVNHQGSVLDAAKAMAQDPHIAGYVVVIRDGKPIGIVTERDIVHEVIAQNKNHSNTPVAAIMSTPLITVDPDADFFTAPELMQKHNISKLVVVKDDVLYGVITVKIVTEQCMIRVNKTIREMVRWTAI